MFYFFYQLIFILLSTVGFVPPCFACQANTIITKEDPQEERRKYLHEQFGQFVSSYEWQYGTNKILECAKYDEKLKEKIVACLRSVEAVFPNKALQCSFDIFKINKKRKIPTAILQLYKSQNKSQNKKQLSALYGIASRSFFMVDTISSGFYIQEGVSIQIPMIDLELEKEFLVITKEQNTSENGYGANATKNKTLDQWAQFYDESYFLLWQEAQDYHNMEGQLIVLQQDEYDNPIKYLNTFVYKKRLMKMICAFLWEAQLRAEEDRKDAYLYVEDIGISSNGLENLNESIYPSLLMIMLDAYKDGLLEHQKFNLPKIKTIHFGWFPEIFAQDYNQKFQEFVNTTDVTVVVGKYNNVGVHGHSDKLFVVVNTNNTADNSIVPSKDLFLLNNAIQNYNINPCVMPRFVKKILNRMRNSGLLIDEEYSEKTGRVVLSQLFPQYLSSYNYRDSIVNYWFFLNPWLDTTGKYRRMQPNKYAAQSVDVVVPDASKYKKERSDALTYMPEIKAKQEIYFIPYCNNNVTVQKKESYTIYTVSEKKPDTITEEIEDIEESLQFLAIRTKNLNMRYEQHVKKTIRFVRYLLTVPTFLIFLSIISRYVA